MNGTLNSDFQSELDSPGFMLWRVTNRWQSRMREALAPFGLTHVQFVLLAALTWADTESGLTQIELARQIRVDPMMASQVLRALEHKGHIIRQPHPDDKRAMLVNVTPEGAELAKHANEAVERADATFFGAIVRQPHSLIEHLVWLDAQNDG